MPKKAKGRFLRYTRFPLMRGTTRQGIEKGEMGLRAPQMEGWRADPEMGELHRQYMDWSRVACHTGTRRMEPIERQ